MMNIMFDFFILNLTDLFDSFDSLFLVSFVSFDSSTQDELSSRVVRHYDAHIQQSIVQLRMIKI